MAVYTRLQSYQGPCQGQLPGPGPRAWPAGAACRPWSSSTLERYYLPTKFRHGRTGIAIRIPKYLANLVLQKSISGVTYRTRVPVLIVIGIVLFYLPYAYRVATARIKT